ncbi:hypothetical protein EW026_g4635 [Hermanssonia centrifuga]|uniref:Uncharacterized protein n=1 Tax=Hermanssonia centrifuga TaxID=98765 RepID=A0A4S4KGH3_9APHY|nr:hypothetical protein EW026_g4635 [Hermanssonia centrifuga]
MFKRVEKRRRKQEEEEELGLDGDMKEVLGLQDTDSEESDSSDDEDPSGSEEEAGANDADDVSDKEEMSDGGLQSVEEDEEEEDKLPPMSVTEAVRDPLYIVSLDPEVRECILCPGKLLKNPTMSEAHKSSKAHNRRFTRFVELVGQAGPGGDVRDLIRSMNVETNLKPQSNEGASSKRAEKRKEKLAAIKAKRDKHKATEKKWKELRQKKKEETEATRNASDPQPDATYPTTPASGEPAKKKRKVESLDGNLKPAVNSPSIRVIEPDTKPRKKTASAKQQDKTIVAGSQGVSKGGEEKKENRKTRRAKEAARKLANSETVVQSEPSAGVESHGQTSKVVEKMADKKALGSTKQKPKPTVKASRKKAP